MAKMPPLDVAVNVHVKGLTDLIPGQAYLVTLPAGTEPEEMKRVRDGLHRWMKALLDPPTFVVTRADIPVEPILPLHLCPQCGVALRADGEG